MTYEVYYLIQLTEDSPTKIQQKLGVEQEFLEYYQAEPFDTKKVLQYGEKLAIIPDSQQSFQTFQDMITLCKKQEQIIKSSIQITKLQQQLVTIESNFNATIYESLCRIERVKTKLAEFPLIFKPLSQTEAANIQRILRNEMSFIEERIRIQKKQRSEIFLKDK